MGTLQMHANVKSNVKNANNKPLMPQKQHTSFGTLHKMSLVTRKLVFGVFDPVRLKWPAQLQRLARLGILAIASRGIILSRQRTTKVLIRVG